MSSRQVLGPITPGAIELTNVTERRYMSLDPATPDAIPFMVVPRDEFKGLGDRYNNDSRDWRFIVHRRLPGHLAKSKQSFKARRKTKRKNQRKARRLNRS